MLIRAIRTVRYAIKLLKLAGPEVFIRQFMRQIYSRDTLISLEKDLDTGGSQISSKIPYHLQRLSEGDLAEIFYNVKTRPKREIIELVQREWYYQCGFLDGYVARTIDSQKPCCLAWLVSADGEDFVSKGFKDRLPGLKKDEIILANLYTYENYRGKNLMPSVVNELCSIVKKRGFRRIIAYVRKDNTASLRLFEKLGFRKFEETPELKFLFYTRRKFHRPKPGNN